MATHRHIPVPRSLQLTGNLNANWKVFQRDWKNYEIATKLTDETEEVRVATLLSCIGREAMDIYDGFQIEGNSIQMIIKAFENYCIGETNESYERFVFNCRNQQDGESVDKYVAELRKLAKTCNFKDLEESLIRDRIVMGVKCDVTRRKLLQEAKLTLSKCIDISRSIESSKKQSQTIQGETSELNKISHTFQRRKDFKKNLRQQSQFSPRFQKTKIKCKFCGKDHEPDKLKCPAYGKQCTKCNKKNHFQAQCKTQMVRYVNDDADDSDESEEFLMAVKGRNKQNKVTALLEVNGRPVRFILDTGATVNTVRKEHVHTNDIKPTTCTRLTMWNGTMSKPYGEVELLTKNPKTGQRCKVKYVVVDNDLSCLLGLETVQAFNLVEVKEENFVSQVDCQSTEEVGLGTASLEVDPNISPRILPCRKVPIALKDKVNKKLQELIKRGILVQETRPTEWVSQMTVVEKENGDVRICIDPQPLNRALMREHCKLPTLDDVLPELHDAKFFSKLDVEEAYWQVKLDEKSSKLTTMITPFGRLCWTRLPFGLKVSSEIFQQRLAVALNDLTGCKNISDDILVYGCGKDEKEAEVSHDRNLIQLQERCKTQGIRLNEKKSQFKKKELRFHGHIISTTGIKADPEKVKAIAKMPAPTDVQGIRRFCGMVQYLAKYIPNLSQTLDPMRVLTKKNTKFEWSTECQKSFDEAKKKVVRETLLAYYDPAKELTLQVDSSKDGIGMVLLQEGKPIEFASKAMTNSQRNWAQIEKELLAVVAGLERFHQYTYGNRIKVQNDHKPLKNILGKPLSQAPLRLQNLMIRLNKYNVNFEYVKGTDLKIADTLSRAICDEHDHHDIEENVINHVDIRDSLIEEIKTKTAEDHIFQEMKLFIWNGWPDKKAIRCELTPYFNLKDCIVYDDGLLMMGERVIIPVAMRQQIKQRIHESHLGYDAMVRRARSTVYWPQINSELKQITQNCESCQIHKDANRKQPLTQHEEGNSPWEKVGIDFCELEKRQYMVIVDYYSNFIEVEYMDNITTSHTIKKLKSQFARHGVPKAIISDSGPQLTSDQFKAFTKEWNITHTMSSPYHHQSNGRAESAVKIIKRLMKKSKHAKGDVYKALLELRNTPRQDTLLSPAQMMFQRHTRSFIPNISSPVNQKNIDDAQHKREKRQVTVKKHYDKNARTLPKLVKGQTVYFLPFKGNKTTWQKGTVTDVHENCLSYTITSDGHKYIRNRVHINPAYIKTDKDATNSRMPSHNVNDYRPKRSLPDGKGPSTSQQIEDQSLSPESNQASENKNNEQVKLPSLPQQDKKFDNFSPVGAPRCRSDPQTKHYITKSGRVVKRPNKYSE